MAALFTGAALAQAPADPAKPAQGAAAEDAAHRVPPSSLPRSSPTIV